MASDLSPNIEAKYTEYSDYLDIGKLSIALIGPDEGLRKAVARAISECNGGGEVREFSTYPPSLDDVPRLLEERYNVIIIDLESDREYALELVESVCANGLATVMVYTSQEDQELILQCMRSGVRDILTLPFTQSTVAAALIRAAARRPAEVPRKKTGGRLLAFLGAKGGAGVTTVACNFAVALAQDTSQSTILIDLDLPLGDAALNLGLESEYSTINALKESERLDWNFLSKLLVEHDSGLKVLAAPGKFPQYEASSESIDKLLAVARQNFDNVVVDVGSKLDSVGTTLLKDARTIYLITQASVPELRNSNRLISQFFSGGGPNLEIVINRYQPHALGVGDEHIAKALTRPVQWKIPNDFAAVRQMQNTATPLVLQDSPIARRIREMASSITGQVVPQAKKKGFSFRGLAKGDSAKNGASDEAASHTRGTQRQADNESRSTVGWQESKPSIPERFAYKPPPRRLIPAEPVLFSRAADTPETSDYTNNTKGKGGKLTGGITPTQESESETRTYKGVTYVKRADGQWHLEKREDAGAPSKDSDNAARKAAEEAAQRDAEEAARSEAEEAVQETPEVLWTAPAPISYGTALGTMQLNATSQIPGKFDYAPAKGYVLPSGTHTIWVTFTPADSTKYAIAQACVPVSVTMATPIVRWAPPAAIPYGTELSAAELNATSLVAGTFSYSPGAGEMLRPGTHTLTVNFTPTDGTKYTSKQASVSVTVLKATPAIAWRTPDPMAYGTALSANELDATASVPGRFAYIPSMGAMLSAGTHTPSALFTPTDSENYTPAQAAVSLFVTKATPNIAWPTPDPIIYGTALSDKELNATAPVSGTFTYSPAAGEALSAGEQTLSVLFTPADLMDYNPAKASVPLVVTKAAPTVITWPAPAELPYGNGLSDTELNATASEPGTFVYSPGAGEVLSPGIHTLQVSFTPEDLNLSASEASVSLVVSKATPEIAWPIPDPICYGAALGAAELRATAQMPGTFVYSPAEGEVPAAGVQTLSVTFTPEETADHTTAQATVSLIVTKAKPVVTWPEPDSVSYGTALSDAEFNATASVPGIFVFIPAKGTVLTPGTQALEANFTPEDTTNYATAQARATLEVTALPHIDMLTRKAADADPESISRILNSNGAATGGQKRWMESRPLFEEGNLPLTIQSLYMAPEFPSRREFVEQKVQGLQIVSNDNLVSKPEERTYKGATYVKGTDGQWHLKQD